MDSSSSSSFLLLTLSAERNATSSTGRSSEIECPRYTLPRSGRCQSSHFSFLLFFLSLFFFVFGQAQASPEFEFSHANTSSIFHATCPTESHQWRPGTVDPYTCPLQTRWASQKMQNSTDATIGIESVVETKVKKPVIDQPVNNPIYLHRNGDDATKDRNCQTQNHPLNSSNHSTPQPWDLSWNLDSSDTLQPQLDWLLNHRIYYDGLCKPEGPLDLAFEDSAPIQVGLVTIQDPYFSPIFQHIPYEIDSWFQVPCIPPSVPAMPPSSSFLNSQNHESSVSSSSSFAISMPTSSHSIQGQPSAADDMFRPTEYQLALDYNRQSTHHEPCQTEAMKQSVHAIISSHFSFSISLSPYLFPPYIWWAQVTANKHYARAGASPAHYKNPKFQPILWSPTKEYRKRSA